MPERFLDVSHEALIRGWPRLRGWLDEDRAGLRLQRRITETAEEWQRSNRDDDLLFRGARLIQVQEWRERHEVELNPLEREFLDASIALKQRLEEAKRRQAEELEEARQRAEEEERLHKAESERMKLLVEKRKRERIFGCTVFLLGIIMLIALGSFINQMRKEYKVAKQGLQKLVEKGRILTEKAKEDLDDETSPIRDVAALRNLALALNSNPRDTEAARLASNLLLQHVWCPPAAQAVTYQKDALLAATFVPGSNNEIFAVSGDGQLLFWNGRELSHFRYLFEKPQQDLLHVVQPGFASFSPDGRMLLIIPPTLASAANVEPAAPSPPQRRAGGGSTPGSLLEPSKLQIWRWSMQKRTYEPAGEDLEIQRLRGSRTFSFAWSPESDRVVLINTRLDEAECAFFEVEGNTFRQLPDLSMQLDGMKIVALAFAANRTGIAAVSVEPTGLLCRVSFIGADDLRVIPGAMHGQDSILLSEGFLPNGIAFGPGNDEITLTSGNSVRILDLRDGTVTPIPPPTFRDQFMRLVVGPGDFATRLIATSLYGRVHVAKGARRQEPAEPVVFSGIIGIPQFSSDGQRLLILSGGLVNVLNSMRLVDVSQLYRPQEAAPEKFEEKPAPPWLADIASAVSAADPSQDGSLMTLEDVRRKYPGSKAGDAYESVWKRFFPKEKSNGR